MGSGRGGGVLPRPQPRSQGLFSSRPLEREKRESLQGGGKRRDLGNEIAEAEVDETIKMPP